MSIKKCKGYDEAFRMKVVRDYYESGMSFYFIAKKYCLSGGDIVKKWIKEYPIDEKELSLISEMLSKQGMAKVEKSKEELLQERISNLEQALAMEKMRSHAFEKMIEITEKEEGISILKKGGAKQ